MKVRNFLMGVLLVGLFMFTSIGAVYAQDAGKEPVSGTAEKVNPLPVVQGAGGFNSQFNGSMTGWAKKGTVVFFPTATAMVSNGAADKWAQAYWTGSTFSNFTYQARIKRGIGEITASNTLFVRMGTSTDAENQWYPGYYFQYSNSGYYSIYKKVSPSSSTALQPWTYSSKIIPGGWNTLKVYANGSTFKFYINGTLMKTITNSWRTNGNVGVGFKDYGGANDKFQVDWATLTKLSAFSANLDEVSAEQEALNEVATQAAPIGDVNGLFH